MFGVWRSVFVLAVGLSLGKAAPSSSSSTPQDCQSMITALSLDNTAKLSGRWNLIEGFSDHNDFIYLLNGTRSSWIDFTPSAEDNRTLTMVAHECMNEACTVDLFNVTIISNITMDVRGDIIESKFNLLSTCEDCLVVNITTAKRCDKSDNPPVYHSLYVLVRGRSLNQSDLEVFHQQARCMNFSLPPDFHYDRRQDNCFSLDKILSTIACFWQTLIKSRFFSAPAPASSTPQDCQSMITALSLDNTAKFSGRWNLIEGLSDHNDVIYNLNRTQSSWMDFTPSAEDNRTLTIVAHVMYGACIVDLFNVTIISNITMEQHIMDVRGDIIETKFNLLSTCEDCLVVNITNKSDNPPVHHSLYILARGRSLNQSDLEVFHQQARCMNFSLPPAFRYDHRQEFCPEHNEEAAVEKPASSTPQDCQSMITALSLDNTAKFSGRWNLIEGLSDHNDVIYTLNRTQSSWMDFTPSAEDNRTLTMVAHVMNGACIVDLFNVTIISNITMEHIMDVRGDIIETKFNLLSTCEDCLVVNITTAKRCDKSDNPPVHHSLYILARGRSLNQSDLEVFHQQARCMNFSLPPAFRYDHRQEFCPEHNEEAAVEKPSSSTPQDCQSMITALSLDNTAKFSGRWNLIEGFSDHHDFIYILNRTQSSWIDFTPSAEDNRTLTMVAHERMNGACTVDLFNVTIISNITMDVRGDIIESKFNLLSTCDDCLVVNITTAKRCDKSDNPPVHHSLYILARGRSLNQSDLEVFHQQARCMNFSLPPAFHYDHRQEFCPEHNEEAAVEKPSSSTPQDCQSMITALSLDNTVKFSGRWNLIEGFSDHHDFIYILNRTQSSWIDFTPSAEDNRTLTMVAHERMNGACTVDLFNVTIISNITMDVRGDIIESKFNLLSTCEDCLVVNITTAKRCDKSDNPPVHHSLYILARGRSLNQSDLEVFHQQARCMNFSLPPAFHYDHRQELCHEHNEEAAVEKPESNVVLSRWDTKTVCN